MKKIAKTILLLVLLLLVPSASVAAADSVNTNYIPYTYDRNHKPVVVPTPYSTVQQITGEALGIGDFKSPAEMFYDTEGGKIYIADTGNNRIAVLNRDYTLDTVLSGFLYDGVEQTFASPSGVCVKNGLLYISDTDHNRIAVFETATLAPAGMIVQPEIKLLGEYTFLPEALAVDLAGRIYVICRNINEGIVQLDSEGNFERFVGAPDVTLTAAQRLWRLFMTEAQKEDMEKAVPTEYNSIRIDNDGFLYLTTQDSEVNPVTKLNCQGNDILRYEAGYYPAGDDRYYLSKSKQLTSRFVDIAVRDDGLYAVLDSGKGRIFVYDQEGNLLYCFGGSGSQGGTFQSASFIEMVDDIILVGDSFNGNIAVFSETEFGRALDQAVSAMLAGDYDRSADRWNNVLQLCPGYDAAYINLARVNIQNKDYVTALKQLKNSGNISYYSEAFEGVRKEFLSKNFTFIFIGVFIAVALLIVLRMLWIRYAVSQRLNRVALIREYRFSSYCMFHPIGGFWDLKREKRGSLRAANVTTLLFVLCYALRAQYSGYIFTGRPAAEINVLYELAKIIIPLGLWCVSAWCFTTLMDGEGSMKDIYIATAYALKPYIVTAIPLFLLSHCLSQDEAFIYTVLSSAVMIWMVALIFFGMMVTNDYTLGKGIFSAVLALVGICLIMFLAMVFCNVVQEMYRFGVDIYKEITYRI